MNPAVWVVGLYGLVSVIGGMIGYVKAKSAPSLIVGSISGALLLWAAAGLRHGNPTAELISMVVPFVLGLRFFMTWRRTKRIMPDFVMFALGLATLTAVGLQWMVP